MGTVVVARNVRKVYRLAGGNVEALRGVSLSFGKREFVVIMGPSGSGKSTLLNMIGTLDMPTDGDVILFEKYRVHELSDAEKAYLRLTKIGFIYQAFHLIPFLTAAENVEIPLRISGAAARERRARALDMLSRVGLEKRALHKPHQLSYGEQQRVAIARSLVNEPELVLADEPTGNLDSETGREIVELMKALCREKGVSFLVATHDPSIAQVADRVLRLKDGTIREEILA
jgi:putative ABC transport system ATP-binding protein